MIAAAKHSMCGRGLSCSWGFGQQSEGIKRDLQPESAKSQRTLKLASVPDLDFQKRLKGGKRAEQSALYHDVLRELTGL